MTMPNFIVVGSQKGGTTALHRTLAQHPQIFMSRIKEPRFFCFENQVPHFIGPASKKFNASAVTQLSAYQALFDDVDGEIAIGETSTDYTTGKDVECTAENMRRHLPDVRIIAVLRHPAERAYSAFNYARQNGWEPLNDFVKALAAEESQERVNWLPNRSYWRNGCYSVQLKPYFARFPRQQIRIYLYEEWVENPEGVVGDICRFLDVDDSFQFDFLRENVTWMRRSIKMHTWVAQSSPVQRLIKKVTPAPLYDWMRKQYYRFNNTQLPPLDPALRHLLIRSYRHDILELQELIGRDLTHWLNP